MAVPPPMLTVCSVIILQPVAPIVLVSVTVLVPGHGKLISTFCFDGLWLHISALVANHVYALPAAAASEAPKFWNCVLEQTASGPLIDISGTTGVGFTFSVTWLLWL